MSVVPNKTYALVVPTNATAGLTAHLYFGGRLRAKRNIHCLVSGSARLWHRGTVQGRRFLPTRRRRKNMGTRDEVLDVGFSF